MQTEMADAESMSALGQKRPFCDAGAMSAFPKTDIRSALGFLQI
jgi:hypothetical protein